MQHVLELVQKLVVTYLLAFDDLLLWIVMQWFYFYFELNRFSGHVGAIWAIVAGALKLIGFLIIRNQHAV